MLVSVHCSAWTYNSLHAAVSVTPLHPEQ